jgi:hypothetical protein
VISVSIESWLIRQRRYHSRLLVQQTLEQARLDPLPKIDRDRLPELEVFGKHSLPQFGSGELPDLSTIGPSESEVSPRCVHVGRTEGTRATYTLVGGRSGGLVQSGDTFRVLVVFSVELGSGSLDLVGIRGQDGLETLVNALNDCGL